MLTEAIRSLNMTRAEFAKRIGVGRPFLSGLETGRKRPSLEVAVRIARETGGMVPVESWVDGDTDHTAGALRSAPDITEGAGAVVSPPPSFPQSHEV
ncbi:MAG: helix-turn-helix transcriptional regulator [Paracoccus sp. (in: a-proteobacteria)]|nr:helix-turn-helix transcriptional regulator [Paracoccus sp. (in: a-proteobacteria)]